MLNQIIAFSLRRRALVAFAAIAIAVYGAVVASRLPIDVLPDLNRPTVTILTESHGLVPEDIERLVTWPIERAVQGATGVTRVRSTSGMALSVINVEFAWGSDIYRNRQVVQERLQLARARLPEDSAPKLAPISSIMGQVQIIGVRSRSGETDPSNLRAWADRTLKLDLLSTPGVAQVVSTGGAPRQMQVTVDGDAMLALDVTLNEIQHAVVAANQTASGGVLQEGDQGPLVSVKGRVQNTEDLATAVVRDDPVRPIRIGDLATVAFGPAAIRTGDAGVGSGEGVLLVVYKQPGVDTIELSRRIDAEVERARKQLPDDIELLPGIYRQSEFIQRAVDNVSDALLDGAILVVAVLFLFLWNARTTIITLTALPLSVAVTAIVFSVAGLSINTMTLGGLAVAVGALVDDAIVDVENVFRRLRQNRERASPRPAMAVVFLASSEVRQPILIGTFVVTSVYLPLFALTGMEGRLFGPIGVTYIVSILASLLVSLTVTPALCSYLLPRSRAVARPQDSAVVRHLRAAAARCIDLGLRAPAHVAGALAAGLLITAAVLATRGTEFLPPFNEGVAQVNLFLPPGTSLQTSHEYGLALQRAVLDVEGVAQVARWTGRAEDDEHAMDVDTNEMIVTFDPDSARSREEVLADIRARVAADFPGAGTSTEQPLAHLLSHMLSGVAAQIAIVIEGDDLQVLRAAQREALAAVRDIPGVTDLVAEPQVLVPQVAVRPNRDALARQGLQVSEVAKTIELALEGAEVSRMAVGRTTYPIVIRLREEDRRDLEGLRRLPLLHPDGRRLRLNDVADIGTTWTSNAVTHENLRRRIVVQHNVQGRSLGEVAADVDAALKPLRASLPEDYSVRLRGQFEAQEQAAKVVAALSALSLALMFALIYAHFRSVNLTLQTLVNIPMAFVGAGVFLLATGQTLSIATLVGLISLGGIAARNKILLLDHYLYLMREEEASFSREMILRAGQERIVPVLMTALTSGIALLPLVLAPGLPGREILYPVASVIVGGLVSTTLLDLFLTPGIFWLFGERSATQAQAARLEVHDATARVAAVFEHEP